MALKLNQMNIGDDVVFHRAEDAVIYKVVGLSLAKGVEIKTPRGSDPAEWWAPEDLYYASLEQQFYQDDIVRVAKTSNWI